MAEFVEKLLFGFLALHQNRIVAPIGGDVFAQLLGRALHASITGAQHEGSPLHHVNHWPHLLDQSIGKFVARHARFEIGHIRRHIKHGLIFMIKR